MALARQALACALGVGAWLWLSAAWAGDYRSQGRCAGFPRVAITAPQGWCVGLVAGPEQGLRMPRRLLEVAPGQFWIVDMGNWERGRGRLLALQVSAAGTGSAPRVKVRELRGGLDRPHGLLRGPDGLIYVAEAGRIWRTPSSEPLRPQTVVEGLPADGNHPLKEIAFAPDGRLFVNLGSATDNCRQRPDAPLPLPCPERQGALPRASVLEIRLDAQGAAATRPYAQGLRNSLGLAVVPSSEGWRLLQAENSVDYNDARAPAEELNELREGSDHGWPYCVSDARGRAVVARGYEGRARCAGTQAPLQAWPAHAAPLQLLWSPVGSPGRQTPWSDKLLAVWHGYRPAGHRVVALALRDGKPAATPQPILSGWQAAPGLRPLGSPAGVTTDHRGWLWVVEDRNATVLVVAPQTP